MNEEAHGHIRFNMWLLLLRKLLKKHCSPVGILGTSKTGPEGGFNTWECYHNMGNGFVLNTGVKLLSKASYSTRVFFHICMVGDGSAAPQGCGLKYVVSERFHVWNFFQIKRRGISMEKATSERHNMEQLICT